MFPKVFVSQLFYNRIPKNYCITDSIRWLKTEKTLDTNTKKFWLCATTFDQVGNSELEFYS